MLGLSLGLGLGSNQAPVGGGGGGPAATLSLDFANGSYSQSGTSYALASLPGYAYSRTGAKAENTSTGVSSAFATNTPAIVSGLGYYTEGAFTNQLQQSNFFASAPWSTTNMAITSNSVAGPDGTTTASTLTASSAAASFVTQSVVVATAATTTSVYAKAGTNSFLQICDDHNGASTSFCNFDLGGGTVGTSLGLTGTITALGSGWYRCSVAYTASQATANLYLVLVPASNSARAAAPSNGVNLYVWQAQCMNNALVGPVINTTSAAVTVNADSMAMTVPNATYSAVYTYADASTQTISTTVSGTTYTVPLYNATLTKSPLAKVVLT